MKIRNNGIVKLILIAVLAALFNHGTLDGCCEGKPSKYFIEQDPLGRLVLLWIDSVEGGALKVSIDNGNPSIISLPQQDCLHPKMAFTEEGHIIVIWAGRIPGKEIYTIYGAKLPFKGKWTNPEIIPDEDELVIITSHKLLVANSHEIHVFWEGINFFQSDEDPNATGHQKFLRSLTGNLKSWGKARNVVLLRQSST